MGRADNQPKAGMNIPVVSRAGGEQADKTAAAAVEPAEQALTPGEAPAPAAAPPPSATPQAATAAPRCQNPLRLLRVPCLLIAAAVAVALLCRCDETKIKVEPPSTATTSTPIPAPATSVATVRVLLTSPASSEAEISTTGAYHLTVDGKLVAQSAAAMPAATVRYRGGKWQIGSLSLPGREAVLAPSGGSLVRLGGKCYRGNFHLLADNGNTFLAVNHVELEGYLAGVLPKELYATWAPATYEALAVAARTFAIYNCVTTGRSSQYDLGDNQASQCYGGQSAETAKSWAAVNATRGVVLSYGPKGQERIFLAQYSASCGGQVNGAYVIRNAQRTEPLEGGQICNDCAACSRYRWPAVRIRKPDILRALGARYDAARRLKRLDRIDVVSATPAGRVVWVDVGGDGSPVRLRLEDIRLALLSDGPADAQRLNSMNCRMVDRGDAIEFTDGRGFGHGVGLCQWGAQGKALKGWSAEQILAFYYPGATLYRVK
jgi:stage II sporulation protein D